MVEIQECIRPSIVVKFSQSTCPSCDRDISKAFGNVVRDEASLVGLPSHTLPEAQEVTSPLKPTNEDPTPKQKPSSPTNPPNIAQPKGKGNLKRITREKGKQAQGEQTQQKAGLSSSKRPCKLEFL